MSTEPESLESTSHPSSDSQTTSKLLTVDRDLSLPAWHTNVTIPESSTISAVRCAGLSGSIGTYAPPALSIPMIPTIIAAQRSAISPTRLFRRTPATSASHLASLSARMSTSRYVSVSLLVTTATAAGVAATARRQISTSDCAGSRVSGLSVVNSRISLPS